VEKDVFRARVIIVIISIVFFDEFSLLFFETVVSLGRVFDCLFSMESRQEEDTQEINGLGRRRFIFPLLDLEIF